MKRIATLTALALAAMLFTANALADSIALSPTKDTFVYSATPTTNYGQLDSFLLGEAAPAGAGTIRGYLQFDLTSLPSNPSLIQSAVFRAYQHAPNTGGPRDCYIYGCTSSWTETGITWNTQPLHDYTTTWAVAEVGDTWQYPQGLVDWVEWDVTDLVRAQASGEYPNYGWSFRVSFETYGAPRVGYFHSNEYLGNPELRPQLVVQCSTAVPEPAAVSLLAVGGLLALRRR
ncbi:MAG: DNRLRE domain-containing protein [Phycisphaerae bacterium]|jgi:MYXO-CTERM domain-containing protein